MKGVIFDFNGTLFLDAPKHVEAWSRISMELRNAPITKEELNTKFSGMTNVEIINALCPAPLDAEKIDEISREKEAIYRQICLEQPESFHLVKGAEKLFDDLTEAGIPFTIASASIKDNIDFFVESFHLDKWIDPENIVYDDGINKDKEEMFVKAAKILNVPVEDVTVIEDSVTGVNAALNVGVKDIRILDSVGNGVHFEDNPSITQIVEDMDAIARD